MRQVIVLIEIKSVEFDRTFAERIENNVYESVGSFLGKYPDLDCLVFSLSEFMDAANDQEIDLENYWITVVKVEK